MPLIKSISGFRGTIGGRAGSNLTPEDIVSSVAGYGDWLIRTGANRLVVIGRDGRPSGPVVSALTAATLQSMGIDVLDCGLATTPTVEMAVVSRGAGGGSSSPPATTPSNTMPSSCSTTGESSSATTTDRS